MLLQGKVMKGDGRGRKLGYPTANLDRRSYRRHPVPEGVWACKIKIRKHAPYRSDASGAMSKSYKVVKNEKMLKGVTVIGVDNKIEVHILDFNKNIYGWHLETAFIKKIRSLRKYKDDAALTRQIKKDVLRARQILN